ncbi:MAG: 4Fe-4S dicluster domain-containing protein [Bacteroidales bacterium]|nr:4Fe-4S dicluster domain-containing protein [Bacteroidales bacterium]
MKKNKTDLNRRQFLKSSAVAVTAMAAIGAGVGLIKKVKGSDTRRQDFLRPPGAISEETFIFGCIKCGLCVQICPVQAIKLAGINEALSYGTPYIDVREQPCDFSCDSLQCVETCPTAVLDFRPFKEEGEKVIDEYYRENDVSDPNFNPFKVQIKAMREAVVMGVAKLNENTCLAIKGEGFKGTPRGENFDGVYRSPGRGRSGGRGQGRGRGRGRGFGGGHRSSNREETKASPLREKIFDREICDLCVTECPIGCKAIMMEESYDNNGNPTYKPKILDGCTGCGVCVMVCPTEQPSIIVEPVNQI